MHTNLLQSPGANELVFIHVFDQDVIISCLLVFSYLCDKKTSCYSSISMPQFSFIVFLFTDKLESTLSENLCYIKQLWK